MSRLSPGMRRGRPAGSPGVRQRGDARVRVRAGGPAPTVGGRRPGGASRGAARLPPQVQHGAALLVAVATRDSIRPDADQRVRQLRHGPASPWTSDRPRAGRASRSSTAGSASATRTRRRDRARTVGPRRAPRRDRGRRLRRRAGSASRRRSSSASRSRGRIDLDRYGGADRLRRELPRLVVPAGPAAVRHGRSDAITSSSCRRSRRSSTRQTAAKLGVAAGAADPAVPRRRRRAHRRDRRDVRPPQALPAGSARGDGGGEAAVPPGDRPARCDQLRAAVPARTSPTAARRSRCDSDEGQRLMLANAAAMNYGFAFRIADLRGAAPIAARSSAARTGNWSSTRRTTRSTRKPVGGGPAVVHRHNACRAYPAELMPAGTTFAETGQAVLLPGTHRTSSYLCVAGPIARTQLLLRLPRRRHASIADFAERGISLRRRSAAQHAAVPLQRRRPGRGRAPGRQGHRRSSRRPGPGRPGPAGGPDAPVRGAALRGNH